MTSLSAQLTRQRSILCLVPGFSRLSSVQSPVAFHLAGQHGRCGIIVRQLVVYRKILHSYVISYLTIIVRYFVNRAPDLEAVSIMAYTAANHCKHLGCMSVLAGQTFCKLPEHWFSFQFVFLLPSILSGLVGVYLLFCVLYIVLSILT